MYATGSGRGFSKHGQLDVMLCTYKTCTIRTAMLVVVIADWMTNTVFVLRA